MTAPSPEPQKVAIVTGASRAIGAGISAAFARAGYAVVATSRSIRPSGEPDLLAVPGDIAEPETAQRVVEQALDRFGRIDTALASLTKGGLDAVTRSLAIEYAAPGLRVNAVLVGVIIHIDGGRALEGRLARAPRARCVW
jgi:NAD(P)-dependent dehydrogenase (short-subunit alcohol dehydrogenase family)